MQISIPSWRSFVCLIRELVKHARETPAETCAEPANGVVVLASNDVETEPLER